MTGTAAAPGADRRLPVFVYGTLRRGNTTWGHDLDAHTVAHEPGALGDHALYVLEYPCVAAHAGATVHGDILHLRDDAYETLLDRLDQIEGYDPGDPTGSLYVRVAKPVGRADGSTLTCWVYVAGRRLQERRPEGREISSGNWHDR